MRRALRRAEFALVVLAITLCCTVIARQAMLGLAAVYALPIGGGGPALAVPVWALLLALAACMSLASAARKLAHVLED